MNARAKSAAAWAAVGAAIAAAAVTAAVFRSRSSTAALGFLFLPFYAAPAALAGALFGYCLEDVHALFAGGAAPEDASRLRAAAGVVLPAGAVVWLLWAVSYSSRVNAVRDMSAPQLDRFLAQSSLRADRFALGAVVEDPNATAEQLDRVARLPIPALAEPMGSMLPVTGANGKGLAVLRLIAMDRRASPETLAYLAKSPNEYVRSAAASNARTPAAALAGLAAAPSGVIDYGLAANPNTPVDALRRLARSDDEYVRSTVARNTGAPPDLLAELAKDHVWHVRRDAASNPKTPAAALDALAQDPDERVSGVAAYRKR